MTDKRNHYSLGGSCEVFKQRDVVLERTYQTDQSDLAGSRRTRVSIQHREGPTEPSRRLERSAKRWLPSSRNDLTRSGPMAT